MIRRIVLSTALVLFASTFLLAQRQPNIPQPRATTELVVRVTYEDDRPVGDQVRVQLSNSSGVPITETFTRGEGEARFSGVEAGVYRLRVSGMDIEEKASDYSFVIYPRQITHLEYMRVRRKPSREQATSTQGHISATALNVPAKAESEFDKGVSALVKQNLPEAQKRFARAIELYPRYAAAYNNLGVIAMQQGRRSEGTEFFRRAVQADEEYAPPYLNLAKSVVADRGYAEAQQLLHKAASLEPTNAEVLAILSMVDHDLNDYAQALANARKVHAIAGHEKFAFAHFVAGRSLEAQNRRAEAVAEYKLFLQEAPQSPSAERVRAAIAAIETPPR